MICQLHHLPHDQGSSNQAAQCKESFIEQGWSVFLQNGFTKDTYWTHPNQYEIMKGSRLDGFSKENKNKAETKRACVMNHVRFWAAYSLFVLKYFTYKPVNIMKNIVDSIEAIIK